MKIVTQVILPFLVFYSLKGISQSEIKNRDKVSVEAHFSLDKYFLPATISTERYTHFETKKSLNFSTGIIGYLKLARNYEIGLGLIYSNKDFIGTFYCEVCDPNIPPTPERVKIRYAELPVTLRYYLLNGKTDLFIEPGVTNSLLISTPQSKYGGGFLSTNKYIISGQFRLGVRVDAGKRINLVGSIMYRNTFTDSFVNSDFRFQSVAIGIGARYKF
jgi:hypothetical protein